jgi:hypothetical protein
MHRRFMVIWWGRQRLFRWGFCRRIKGAPYPGIPGQPGIVYKWSLQLGPLEIREFPCHGSWIGLSPERLLKMWKKG